MSRESMKHRPRVGQCRWKAVVYKPGAVLDYEDYFVACAYPCHATKVSAKSVHYECNDLPYIAGFSFWGKLHPTYRAAVRAALAEMKQLATPSGEGRE